MEAEKSLGAPEGGIVIGVPSGKGGTGKSLLTISLASALANLGQRVLVVDGDLGFADIAIMVGISPDLDLGSVCVGGIDIERAILPVECGAQGESFDLLPGRCAPSDRQPLSEREIDELISAVKALSPQYDRVIIDLGSGVDPDVLKIAGACDQLLIVLTEEPAAIVNGYSFIQTIRQTAPDVQQMLIVNKAESTEGAERAFEMVASECQDTLNFKPHFLGCIHWDWAAKMSTKEQCLIIPDLNHSNIAFEIREIADKLTNFKKEYKSGEKLPVWRVDNLVVTDEHERERSLNDIFESLTSMSEFDD